MVCLRQFVPRRELLQLPRTRDTVMVLDFRPSSCVKLNFLWERELDSLYGYTPVDLLASNDAQVSYGIRTLFRFRSNCCLFLRGEFPDFVGLVHPVLSHRCIECFLDFVTASFFKHSISGFCSYCRERHNGAFLHDAYLLETGYSASHNSRKLFSLESLLLPAQPSKRTLAWKRPKNRGLDCGANHGGTGDASARLCLPVIEAQSDFLVVIL